MDLRPSPPQRMNRRGKRHHGEPVSPQPGSSSMKRSHSKIATSVSGQFTLPQSTKIKPKPSALVLLPANQLDRQAPEIMSKIVAELDNDKDIQSLLLVNSAVHGLIHPFASPIWREKFLVHFDHPFITETEQEAWKYGYKGRRLTLRIWAELAKTPNEQRWTVHLECLRDMVIETYNQPNPRLPSPTISRNLAYMCSPHSSAFMTKFLSFPFYPKKGSKYGRPHSLFDALQVTLSHFLLSPRSPLSYVIESSRDYYDLAIVYNWDMDLELLYREKQYPNELAVTEYSIMNVAKKIRPFKDRLELDLNALLHIRNFWHRHLIEHSRRFGAINIVENTYSSMAKQLAGRGLFPKQWSNPFKDNDLGVATVWHGHYSTLSQWPKKRKELEEVQTLAEDWRHVDPLQLNFDISQNNEADGFWPPLFADVLQLIPYPSKRIFIKGIAPFVDPSRPTASLTVAGTTPHLPKYHPYLAMRIRGVIHTIKAEPQVNWEPNAPVDADGNKEDHSIPGWNRVLMVMYMPTKQYLIRVLENTLGEYGDPFLVAVSNALQGIPAAGANNNTTAPNTTAAAAGPPVQFTQEAYDVELTKHLHDKLASVKTMDRQSISDMEESYKASEYLSWDDIEYAYCYEGAIIPGGKIMMGRYWRICEGGVEMGSEWHDQIGWGEDAELEADGGYDEVQMRMMARRRARRFERGPFCFWAE